MIQKIKEWFIYQKLCKIARASEYDGFHSRYIIDLRGGYMFYFPETGKIYTTRKGLVYKKKNGKLECWYSLSELKKLVNAVLDGWV